MGNGAGVKLGFSLKIAYNCCEIHNKTAAYSAWQNFQRIKTRPNEFSPKNKTPDQIESQPYSRYNQLPKRKEVIMQK